MVLDESILGMFLLRRIQQLWDRWPPGVFVAMLGVLAAIFPLAARPDMSTREKFVWASGFAALMVLESWAIFKERSKQERALADQMKSLNDIREASEEHTKSMLRLLMAGNSPADSLKSRALKLSEAILDFIYQRLQNAPAPLYPTEILILEPDTNAWNKRFQETMQRQGAAFTYESNTLAMYRERFLPKVLAILGEFQEQGVADDWLHQLAGNPTGSNFIKMIGQRLGEIAELLVAVNKA